MELDKYSRRYIHYYTDQIPTTIENIFNNRNIRNIADLGSGDGSILYSLFKKGYLDNMQKVIAIDISKERINKVKKISDRILCIVADVCKLCLNDNVNLDLVISNQVVEHVQDEKALAGETHRVLVKNGLFYLSTVYKKWYGWYFYRCNRRWVLDPTHLREYRDENQLLSILKKYNFQILKNKKTLHWFPIIDFFVKRLNIKNRKIYNNDFMFLIRKIKIPILGYYNYEILCQKK